jgi:hypothetical protein
VIKQWKIGKRFEAYNPNFADTQVPLLKQAQLGLKAQSDIGPSQKTNAAPSKQPAAPAKQAEAMVEEQIPEGEEEEPFPMSEHAKNLGLLNKAEMTKYLGDLTAAKDTLIQSGMEIPKLVNYHLGSKSVSFLGNLVARLKQQIEELMTADKQDNDLIERCKQAVLENTKNKDRMMRVLQSGQLSITDYKAVVDRELGETLDTFKGLKKHLKNSKAVGEFFIAHVKILQAEQTELATLLANQ